MTFKEKKVNKIMNSQRNNMIFRENKITNKIINSQRNNIMTFREKNSK